MFIFAIPGHQHELHGSRIRCQPDLNTCMTRPEKLGFLADNAVMTSSPCPYCNASVTYGSNPCAVCGANLEWNVLPDGFKLQHGHSLELVRTLGRGGFGVTYLANHAGLQVAVKECFPDGLVTRDSNGSVKANLGCETEFNGVLRKFLLEARLLNQIKHPVSTKFLALWQENNTAYLMMEFIEGETLEARIVRGSHLSEFEAVALLEPVLDLLEGVHAQQLLHRDIKPANIMLTKNGVELIDFGSVIKFDTTRSTKISSKILTPAYAPLELYGSQVRLGPSSDLYSLAASVYEAMTGVRVPSALDRSNGAVVQPLEAILNSVSREFSKLIARALELRIDDRFGTAQEMRAALRGVPVFSKPASSTSAVQASTAGTNATSSRTGFQIPRWALVVGIVGLIFGMNRLLAFNDWRQALDKTRVIREGFIRDQCEILKRTDTSFTCEFTLTDANATLPKLELLLTSRQGFMPSDAFWHQATSPEFIDYVNDLAMNTMDLFQDESVQILVRQNVSNSPVPVRYSIDRNSYTKHMTQPTTARIRNQREARAKLRLTMPSSETYAALVAKREIEQANFAIKRGMKINRLLWKQNSKDGLSVLIGHPGSKAQILALSEEKEFRLELRDAILRLHHALPIINRIDVSIGDFVENTGVWSVGVYNFYGNNEFDALAKASNGQLNDIWRFSMDAWSVSDSNQRVARAWLVPVPVRGIKELRALAVVQASRDNRSFQPPAPAQSFTASSYSAVDSLPFNTNSVDYGNTKLLTGCCSVPTVDVFVSVASLEPVLAQRPLKLEVKYDPPQWLRLRLSDDRTTVIVEFEKLNWARGYLFELDRFGMHDPTPFMTTVAFPTYSVMVSFKTFESTNFIRLMALDFDSVSLVHVNPFGKSNGGADAKDLAASALETTALTRDQLIALKRGESLEFGPNLKWVKK
jgi:serine/threonine protein kinase